MSECKIKILYGLEAAGGGALKHLVYIVTRLNPELFDITVMLSNLRLENAENEIKKMQCAGAKVIFIPIHRNIRPINDLIALSKIWYYIYTHKFHIVHAHSSKAGALFRIASWLARTPKVYYTPHCFYFQSQSGFSKWFFIKIEKLMGKITTGIIVSDAEMLHLLRNKIVSPSKAYNINNAIDFNEYNPTVNVNEAKHQLGISSDSLVVGAIGRLTTQKDWITYIYAANEVIKTYPNVVFLIVGEGELRINLELLIAELGLQRNIILTGYVIEIYKIYGIIDVFVNTSLWEGLPYVFLEAMHYKKPIIATGSEGETVVINRHNGLTSPQHDFKNVAENIILLLQDKTLSENLGKKGYELILEKYSFNNFIQKHEALYLERVK
ncbi:MAG: glycosyltransferase [Bacteroidales bacterium]|nr:glycosyltransferase [Bacteroidales bacterium]